MSPDRPERLPAFGTARQHVEPLVPEQVLQTFEGDRMAVGQDQADRDGVQDAADGGPSRAQPDTARDRHESHLRIPPIGNRPISLCNGLQCGLGAYGKSSRVANMPKDRVFYISG